MGDRNRRSANERMDDVATMKDLLPLWESTLSALKFTRDTQLAAEEIGRLIGYQAGRIDQLETQVSLLRAEVEDLRIQMGVAGQEND